MGFNGLQWGWGAAVGLGGRHRVQWGSVGLRGCHGVQWGWGEAVGLGDTLGVSGMQWGLMGLGGRHRIQWDAVGFNGVQWG